MPFINEFGIKTSYYILAAASTTVALSWNESIRGMIEANFPKNTVAPIVYSLCLTLFLIMLVKILPDVKNELPETTQKKIINTQAEHMKSKHEMPYPDDFKTKMLKLGGFIY